MNPEQARFLADFFADTFEQESRTTARVLAAVPDERRDYRPDDKSRTAWELATHLVTGDLWFLDSICDGDFRFDPEAEKKMTAGLKTIADVVEFYTREFPQRIQRLRSTPAEKLATVVDFFGLTRQPAASFLIFANNHSVHHRGQLASYLRAMGSKVPSIYGGSADE
ncbi:MAG TPA: DinB family protein, partial [Vicinamibacterales bacterium]|nr:DinB family protein [Vicinamibacterales bacterium]